MAHILGGIGHGKTVEEEIAQRTPRPAGSTTTLPEGIEGTPIIVNGQIIGWNIGGEFFTQEEVDALIATGKFPEEPGGGGAGRAPPSFASTQAAQTQAEAFAREQAAAAARVAAEAARANKAIDVAPAAAKRPAFRRALLNCMVPPPMGGLA